MTTNRDSDRLIRAFLREGEEELSDRVYDAVRADIEHKQKRATFGPWRTSIMNKLLPIGLGAGAVVVIGLLLGSRFLGSPTNTNVGGPGVEATSTATPGASAAEPTPSPTPWTGLPQGSFVVTSPDDHVQVTLDIQSPGWSALPAFDAITKDDDGLDPPDTVGGALIAWSWPAGTEFLVYEDPCHWSTSPATRATTWREFLVALEGQAETEVLGGHSMDIPGYDGVVVGLQVPMTYEVPGATREEEFAACDQGIYGIYGVEGGTEPERSAQGPGQVDELWIVDVEGSIVILDATYGPETPIELQEELQALARSATFEVDP